MKKPPRLPWQKECHELTKYDWATAVGLHPKHHNRARDLRIVNVIMQKADSSTCMMWASQRTIALMSGVADERQVRASMRSLEASGAIQKSRIKDLQPDMITALEDKMGRRRNRRGSVYKLKLFWAYETFEGHFKRKAAEPEHLRKVRQTNRTAAGPFEGTTPVRQEQDRDSPDYTNRETAQILSSSERKESLASTRGENRYAKAKGRAA